MPIVFVHGANNRIEDAGCKEGVACKAEFFLHHDSSTELRRTTQRPDTAGLSILG